MSTTALKKLGLVPLMASAQRQMNAVVVSSGLMNKTVKYFNHTEHLLVHDPASSLRTGDIISISSGWRVSKNVHHVVRSIIAPFGEPIEGRPPVPTEEERMAERVRKKEEKEERKRVRNGGKVEESANAVPVVLIEEKKAPGPGKLSKKAKKKALKKALKKAAKDATEKVPEKGSEKVLKKVLEKVPEKGSEKVPGKGSDKVPEKVSEKVPEKVSEKVPEKDAEKEKGSSWPFWR